MKSGLSRSAKVLISSHPSGSPALSFPLSAPTPQETGASQWLAEQGVLLTLAHSEGPGHLPQTSWTSMHRHLWQEHLPEGYFENSWAHFFVLTKFRDHRHFFALCRQMPHSRWNGAPSRVADGERETDARAAGVQDLLGTQEVT